MKLTRLYVDFNWDKYILPYSDLTFYFGYDNVNDWGGE